MKKAVFLDRDGVITQEPPYYAHRIDQLRLLPKAGEAIKLLNKAGFLVIIITNQAGIARGYYKETDMHIYNNEMLKRLKRKGAQIDAIYFCPHHPNATVKEYKINCTHRKPKTGMLQKAKDRYNINLESSYLIGDKLSDIEAGKRAGCKTILVKTGYGFEEIRTKKIEGLVFDNLYESVKGILKDDL